MRTLYMATAFLGAVLAGSGPASAQARFPVLSPDQMTPAQKVVADSVMRSRKNLAGPFNAWLRSPELADLAKDRRPRGMTADQALVYDICLGLHRDKARIPDALFRAMVARFGEQGMIDLIGLAGYYATVSMTLNVAASPR